jgi:formylglycine-generating enzyme required for sulfatase activity
MAIGALQPPRIAGALSLSPWLLVVYAGVTAAAASLPWAVGSSQAETLPVAEPQTRAGSNQPAPTRQARPDSAEMSLVPSGSYRPFFKTKAGEQPIPVKAFLLDNTPVTRRAFLEFATNQPNWQRSRVKRLFAEPSYLSDWQADLDLGKASATTTQTFVSWFAAKAYCEYRGKRLPTLVEWEHAAATDESTATGAGDPRAPFRFAMGRVESAVDRPGFGSIWEWTLDFNGSLVSGQASPDETAISSLFCGAGARSVDASNYGAFLRYSFRSSLKANYALKNLGFRCARDVE